MILFVLGESSLIAIIAILGLIWTKYTEVKIILITATP